MELLVLLWVICAIAAGAITNAKGRGWLPGLIGGGLLGIFGVIVAAFMRPGSTAPPGMESAVCPRCNAEQNVPIGDRSFECWRCHYVAHVQGGKEAI